MGKGVFHELIHGLDSSHGLIGVHGRDLRIHYRRHALGRSYRAHQQVHFAPRQLRERDIQLSLRILRQALVLDIRGHADHLGRLRPTPHDYVLAQWILVGPETPGEGFVDDEDLGGLGIVGGCEGAGEFYTDHWQGDLIGPDGTDQQMRVHCWCDDDGCWQVGVGQVDEAIQLPAWLITITQAPAGQVRRLRWQ